MKFFRKLGFQLVLFFVVAITIPIVMLMVSSITTTSSSMENNMKVTSEQTLNEAQNQFTTYLKTLSQPVGGIGIDISKNGIPTVYIGCQRQEKGMSRVIWRKVLILHGIKEKNTVPLIRIGIRI